MNEQTQSRTEAQERAFAHEAALRAGTMATALALEQKGYEAPNPAEAAQRSTMDFDRRPENRVVPSIQRELRKPLVQLIDERAAKVGLIKKGYGYESDPNAMLSDEAFRTLLDTVQKVEGMLVEGIDPANEVHARKIASPHEIKLRVGNEPGFNPDVADAAASPSYQRVLSFLGVDGNALETSPVKPIEDLRTDVDVLGERRIVPTEFPGISLQQDTILEDKPDGREFIGHVPRLHKLTLVPTPVPQAEAAAA